MKKTDKKKRKRTAKQTLWCEFYMQHWNATQAAEDAEYKGNRITLASVGYENLRKPHLREYIEERLSQTVMTSNEVLSRLGNMARSFDMTRYIKLKERFEVITKIVDGKEKHYKEFAGYVISFDMDKLQADGFSHLIKKIKQNKKAGIEIEWHDQMNALVHIGKHHNLFQEKFEIPEDGLILKVIGFDVDKL